MQTFENSTPAMEWRFVPVFSLCRSPRSRNPSSSCVLHWYQSLGFSPSLAILILPPSPSLISAAKAPER